MFTKAHDERDDVKVWLSDDETERLLEAADSTERQVALALGVRCGLRSAEVLDVTPADISETDVVGSMLKVRDGKGGKSRQTPIPENVKTQIETANEYRDKGADEPIVSVSTTQSLRNWIQGTAEVLAEETDTDEWLQVSFHDLRRTWATHLVSKDVDPLVICDWGGWQDLETFLDHYRGQYSPDAQRREREKVGWL
jgi:Site-specific recombinase XerD